MNSVLSHIRLVNSLSSTPTSGIKHALIFYYIDQDMVNQGSQYASNRETSSYRSKVILIHSSSR